MNTSRSGLSHVLASLVLPAAAAACHDRAAEPAPVVVIDAGHATPHDIHHIVDSDHRRMIHLVVDDKIMLPNDPVFDWRVDFEDKSSFAPFDGDAGQGAPPVYRATKAGIFRMMVYGDPKCLTRDGGCGISKRRWDITAEVK